MPVSELPFSIIRNEFILDLIRLEIALTESRSRYIKILCALEKIYWTFKAYLHGLIFVCKDFSRSLLPAAFSISSILNSSDAVS